MAGSGLGFAFPILAGKLLDTFKAQDNISGGYAILFCDLRLRLHPGLHPATSARPKFEMVELKAA